MSRSFWFRLQNDLVHWTLKWKTLYYLYNPLAPQTRAVEPEPKFQVPTSASLSKSVRLQPPKVAPVPQPKIAPVPTALVSQSPADDLVPSFAGVRQSVQLLAGRPGHASHLRRLAQHRQDRGAHGRRQAENFAGAQKRLDARFSSTSPSHSCWLSGDIQWLSWRWFVLSPFSHNAGLPSRECAPTMAVCTSALFFFFFAKTFWSFVSQLY